MPRVEVAPSITTSSLRSVAGISASCCSQRSRPENPLRGLTLIETFSPCAIMRRAGCSAPPRGTICGANGGASLSHARKFGRAHGPPAVGAGRGGGGRSGAGWRRGTLAPLTKIVAAVAAPRINENRPPAPYARSSDASGRRPRGALLRRLAAARRAGRVAGRARSPDRAVASRSGACPPVEVAPSTRDGARPKRSAAQLPLYFCNSASFFASRIATSGLSGPAECTGDQAFGYAMSGEGLRSDDSAENA